MDSHIRLLAANPLDVRGIRLFFLKWKPGFRPDEVAHSMEKMFIVTVNFPGLLAEYHSLLENMGATIDAIQKPKENMASRITKALDAASIRVLVSDTDNLPVVIRLPSLDAGIWDQTVVYGGLPGQCFICKENRPLRQSLPKEEKEKFRF
ncbi:hypothetical protein KP509_19G002600 [Ceratopteris richardii]|uniref:Uncharacterized protein n=1 Tax=Ceratopteris richardii TaxID=49495 RepID=A0A8T2SJC0_CERRI|nr:hypothetical protein KP509_19G002600 [Ceratopteris richardii]